MTQCDKILRHLKEIGAINPISAMEGYGIMRLAARISDLRQDGVNIGSRTKQSKNRYGETVRYKEYFLEV